MRGMLSPLIAFVSSLGMCPCAWILFPGTVTAPAAPSSHRGAHATHWRSHGMGTVMGRQGREAISQGWIGIDGLQSKQRINLGLPPLSEGLSG